MNNFDSALSIWWHKLHQSDVSTWNTYTQQRLCTIMSLNPVCDLHGSLTLFFHKAKLSSAKYFIFEKHVVLAFNLKNVCRGENQHGSCLLRSFFFCVVLLAGTIIVFTERAGQEVGFGEVFFKAFNTNTLGHTNTHRPTTYSNLWSKTEKSQGNSYL